MEVIEVESPELMAAEPPRSPSPTTRMFTMGSDNEVEAASVTKMHDILQSYGEIVSSWQLSIPQHKHTRLAHTEMDLLADGIGSCLSYFDVLLMGKTTLPITRNKEQACHQMYQKIVVAYQNLKSAIQPLMIGLTAQVEDADDDDDAEIQFMDVVSPPPAKKRRRNT